MSPARDQPAFLSTPLAAETVAALLDAAAVCRRIRANARAQTKRDASPVTVADFAVQAVVARRLAAAVPGLTLVAEEDSHSLRGDSGRDMLVDVLDQVRLLTPQATADEVREWIDIGSGGPGADFWTLDPIDGTKGFRRSGQYAVALARIRHGEVILAGLACPALELAVDPLPAKPGVMAVAAPGEGAWARAIDGGAWARLHVSQVEGAGDSRGLRSVEGAHTDEAWLERLLTGLHVERPPARMDSQAKYLVVAAGLADWIFRLVPAADRGHREWIWDQAAGSLIVEEAGGRVTDLEGGRLDFGAGRRLERNLGVLTTNGLLHEAALAALRETFPR